MLEKWELKFVIFNNVIMATELTWEWTYYSAGVHSPTQYILMNEEPITLI